MKLDLHVHSKFSDGDYSVKGLIDLYKKTDLDGFALTDHDTIDAFSKKNYKIKDIIIIPGIELSCTCKKEETHILGIDIDPMNQALIRITEELQVNRLKRAKKMIKNLKKDKIYIGDEITKNKSVGRPHIAKELFRKGYAKSIDDAFSRYLFKESKYYVKRDYLNVKRAIELIHNAGGKAILAHPGRLSKYEEIIEYVKDLGIDGIEYYHPSNNKTIQNYIADNYMDSGWIFTGGSDFHRNTLNLGKYYTNVDVNKLNNIRGDINE